MHIVILYFVYMYKQNNDELKIKLYSSVYRCTIIIYLFGFFSVFPLKTDDEIGEADQKCKNN